MGFFSAIKKIFGGKEKESGNEEKADLQDLEGQEFPRVTSENAYVNENQSVSLGGESHKSVKEDNSGISIQDSEKSENELSPQPEKSSVDTEIQKQTRTEKPDENIENNNEINLDSYESQMLVRLREAEPKLSSWLNIILENVDKADDLLWKRLAFLLRSLNASENEITSFLEDFKKWTERMDYEYLEEFRSELQYRLALALDLEDEEDERNRLVLKLAQSLKKTREEFGRKLDNLLGSHGELNTEFWEELEELFIMADFGYDASTRMVNRLQERARRENIRETSEARRLLREELKEIFKKQKRIAAVNKPEVILFAGVNGAGKTTTIAKLAYRARMQGKKTLIVAGDTFRAAAIEQLEEWAKRVGSDFYAKKAGADPASVAWEALEYALLHNIDVVLVDTAGRLQTKTNLMEELGKIRQVIGKKHQGAPHRTILVLDATTGQNALSQAKLFKDAAGISEIILTKLDGTAKGGVAIAVAMQENLPVSYVGLGEKMEDLRPFNGEDYTNILFGDEEIPGNNLNS